MSESNHENSVDKIAVRAIGILEGEPSLGELNEMAQLEPIFWQNHPNLTLRAVKRAQSLGEAFLAYDLADQVLKEPTCGDPLIRRALLQQQALSLARTGSVKRAQTVLLKLRQEGANDPETLGILGRTYKDCGPASYDLALEAYRASYGIHRDYYTGINTASMALLSGRIDEARTIAAEVICICERELSEANEKGKNDCWILATLAEAYLICGDAEKSRGTYRAASEKAVGRVADLASTRRQARLLLEKLGFSRGMFDDCFPVPKVAAFAGHMMDAPDRPFPRFPPQYVEAVFKRLCECLDYHGIRIGYCSGAAGADLLFAEALLERRGEVHVVLPFEIERFRKTSVDGRAGGDWSERFDRVVRQAASVRIVNPDSPDSPVASYEFANQVFSGLAQIKADSFGVGLVTIALWDGQPGDGGGGTADQVEFWRKIKLQPEIIDLRQITGLRPPPRKAVYMTESILRQEIRALLFADVHNYGQLREKDIHIFVDKFMMRISELITSSPYAPIIRNTWGDALFMAFKDVRDAGLFALQLRELIKGVNWKVDYGLAANLQIRVGLHAGPVYFIVDPIINQYTVTGIHVTQAARIEPVTEEGQVFVSEPFAALSAITGVKEYRCDYLGRRPLAKNAGSYPIFLLRSRTE